MYSDEGIGVHIVKMIEKNYKFRSDEHSIDFIDGGTLASFLIHIIAEYDELIVVDCLEADDGNVGDVYFFDFRVMPKSISWSGSAHEVEMLQTLQMMDLAGDLPTTHILGVIPNRVEPMSFELSDEVCSASKVASNELLRYLESIGIRSEKIAEFSVRDMAKRFEKGGNF